MRYAALKKNDVSNAPGVCVSFFTQGCPHHCSGCFNKETWDFGGGKEFTIEVLKELIDALTANGIKRDLCILGGEPLCQENQFLTYLVISEAKKAVPDIQIYIWTGYAIEDLDLSPNSRITQIFNLSDYLIDGPFIEAEKDMTLKMRGSRNQRIINLDKYKNF